MGIRLLALSSLLFLVGPLLAGQAQVPSRLLVLSKDDLTLSVIDPVTLEVLAKLPSGDDPHEVAVSADGRTAFIANYGARHGGFNTLTTADIVGMTPLPPVDLGGLRGPHDVVEAGGKIYFTAEPNKAIARYDPETRQIDWIMGTGQNGSHMVFVAPDLQRIYTVDVHSGTATIFDAPDPAVIGYGRFAVGPGPSDWERTSITVGEPAENYEGFDVSPDGRELWTASPRTGQIAIVDLQGKRLLEKVDAGATGANRVKFTPDGTRVLVSRLSIPADGPAGAVVVFDAATRKEVKRFPDAGSGTAGLLIQPDGARAYAASQRDHFVAVIDLEKMEIIGRIDAGPRPDGMAWAGR